jgi:hypothetical protein
MGNWLANGTAKMYSRVSPILAEKNIGPSRIFGVLGAPTSRDDMPSIDSTGTIVPRQGRSLTMSPPAILVTGANTGRTQSRTTVLERGVDGRGGHYLYHGECSTTILLLWAESSTPENRSCFVERLWNVILYLKNH